MPAHLSKSYFRNIRLNIMADPYQNETSLANAVVQYRSTESASDARSICFEIVNAILSNYSTDQIDFVFTVRINSTKHQEYFADHRAIQDTQNKRNQAWLKRLEEKRAKEGNPVKKRPRRSYHSQSRKRILSPDE